MVWVVGRKGGSHMIVYIFVRKHEPRPSAVGQGKGVWSVQGLRRVAKICTVVTMYGRSKRFSSLITNHEMEEGTKEVCAVSLNVIMWEDHRASRL
jgi:hypothetical protein